MNFINRLKRRLRTPFRPGRVAPDPSGEIRLHARQWNGLAGIALDVRLGLRILRKSWGLTLIGGLAMAIAIGAGTTAFAVLNAYEGDTIPLPEGDRLVRLMGLGPKGTFTSVQDFDWWRQQIQSVEDISAFVTVERLLVAGDGSHGLASVARMTSSGFRVARVQPLVGRPLLEEDERAGAAPVAVIGYGVWKSRFMGDRAAVGQTLQIGGVDHIVVGIMPEDFAFPISHQVWIPFQANSLSDARRDVVVFGRLRPGVTLENAQAEIAVKGPAPGDPWANAERRTRVLPYAQSLVFRPAWWSSVPWVLVLLLLPPCANIGILIYARNVSRQEEFAARYVLGAGRGRIVCQLLIEAFLLAGAAATAGLLLARQILGRIADEDRSFPFWVRPTISLETALYVAGLAAFAAVVAGGVPALRATGRMRQSGFHGLGSRTSPKLGLTWTALVVLQVALSTAVLPRCGEGIWELYSPYLNGREFAAEEYMTARVALGDEPPAGTATGAAPPSTARSRDLPAELVRQVQDRLGISSATVSASIDGIDEKIAWIETDIPGRKPFLAGSNHVDKAYFDVFKAPLLAGRAFETGDFIPAHPVVIVDRAFAEQLAGQNPLGTRVRYVPSDEHPSEVGPWYEIVGLVDRVSPNAQRPFLYHPILPGQTQQVSLTLRTGSRVPSDFSRRLAGSTTAIDPAFQVRELRKLGDLYQAERTEENLFGAAFATVLLVVVLFSAAGIHTLVVFAVVLRRREIGIRSALGAPPVRLVADVFRRDLSPVVAGAIAGALLAFPVDKLIPRSDGLSVPIQFVSAVFLFMVVIGLLAVAGPARRALRIDSVEALRES